MRAGRIDFCGRTQNNILVGPSIYSRIRMNMPLNDKNAGWNGTYKNQQLKSDVYVWVLNAVCSNGIPLEVKGDISLIR